MKANEIRIGNYVMFFKDAPSKVIGFANGQLYIHYNDEKYFITELDDASPIPLTEEWLLKFGFEKSEIVECLYNIIFDKFGISITCEGDKILDIQLSSTNISGAYPNKEHFKYVHQLQNLYFALTGEELTMK